MTLLQMFQNHKIGGFFPDSTEKKACTLYVLMNTPGCLQLNTYE